MYERPIYRIEMGVLQGTLFTFSPEVPLIVFSQIKVLYGLQTGLIKKKLKKKKKKKKEKVVDTMDQEDQKNREDYRPGNTSLKEFP